MKKIALWVLVALLSPLLAFAATINAASDGTLWLEKSEVTKVEVPFDQDVFAYGDAWKQAYQKPGTVVSVETHEEWKRDGLLHIVKTSIVDVGIVYDKTGVHLVHNQVAKQEAIFSPYAIIWLALVILMATGVWRVTRNEKIASPSPPI